MAALSNSLVLKHGLSLWCPQSSSLDRIRRHSSVPPRSFRRSYVVAASSFANENREFVIVGGGNAAGYAARTFVEHGMADGKLCIVSKELLKYGSLIVATGSTASRFPEQIGGNLPGVHYIRDAADADSLISSLKKARKVVVVGGGYIGMEVAAATAGWKLDTTVIFPDKHFMQRLFTSSLAQKYEELYQENGVKFVKGVSIKNLEAGPDGHIAAVKLENGPTVEADTVIIGIGAKPAVSLFEKVGLNTTVGGIQVDGQFRTNIPGIFAIGDVAAFPLKMYNRIARVEHVDHARRSAEHCVKALLSAQTHTYDYLPYFYSRVFEYEGSPRKIWWQFYGDNVGETVEIGNFDPKIATFWIDSGKVKGVLLESGSPEEFQLLPKLARRQPCVDKTKLQTASSVEEALQIAQASLQD